MGTQSLSLSLCCCFGSLSLSVCVSVCACVWIRRRMWAVCVCASCRGVAFAAWGKSLPLLRYSAEYLRRGSFLLSLDYLLLLPASASLLHFVLLLLSPSNARSFSSPSSSSSSALSALAPAKVYLDIWFAPGLEFWFPSLQFLSDFGVICWPDFLLGAQDSSLGCDGAWQLLKTLAVWLVGNFDSILIAVWILNFVLGEIVIAVENYEQ